MPAIFIGRFQPFHKGHLEAIKWILKKEKKVLIIIGSSQEFLTKNNPFSFKERKEMIEESLLTAGIKNYKIYGVPDFFNDILWAKTSLKILKLKPTEATVFTHNSWTKNCFKKGKVKVLPHPIFFNGLSGTEIREKIVKNKKWQHLVPGPILEYLKKNKGEERIKSSNVLPEKKIVDFIKEEIKETKAKGGIVGISGGIDSSVMASLAKKALGEKVIFLQMPFLKTCPLIDNVALLKKQLKIKVERFHIGDIYENFLKILPEGNKNTKGNLKPRLRMATLYYFANLFNLLVIGTGNKSELEIGYFTKYGDGGVDIEPIGDLYKTEIIEMAKRLKLPKQIIETIPTADLWPGQTDEKEIGISYQKLDTILKLLNQGFNAKDISFLTNISPNKIRNIIERKRKNAHKLSPPPICQLKILNKNRE
jgi:NAD+ synthase